MSTEKRPAARLSHDYHKVPVTGLAFYNDDTLLAGEGTYLNVYDVGRTERIASREIFKGQAVHGIIVEPTSCLVVAFGGSRITTLRLQRAPDGSVYVERGGVHDVGDWILDAAFNPWGSENDLPHVALVTAHNALLGCHLEIPSNGGGPPTLQVRPSISGSNCILYSAHISWLSASHCLIASGTAFGDIVVWSGLFNKAEGWQYAQTQIHYTFSAHEGSVFGVELSHLRSADILDGRQHLLATCSDDRMIKVWDVSNLNAHSPTLMEIQTDTGFGSKEDTNAQAPPLLAKVMGHLSRIWSVRLSIDEITAVRNQIRFRSFGEDATVITWNLNHSENPQTDLPYVLHQKQLDSAHNGKNIWSVASNSPKRYATGAVDGSISLFSDKSVLAQTHVLTNVIQPTDTSGKQRDPFKAYAFVGESILVATRQSGQVLKVNMSDADYEATTIGEFQGLYHYSVVASAGGIVFLAGTDGQVHVYRQQAESMSLLHQSEGKTAGLFPSSTGPERIIALLVTSVKGDQAELCLVPTTDSDQSMCKDELGEWTLVLPQGFVVTSFVYFVIGQHQYGIVGGRNGSLLVFDVASAQRRTAVAHQELVSSVHGKETITDLLWYPATEPSAVLIGHLFSTGRDGTLAVHGVQIRSGKFTFELVHQLALPFGPNIEGLELTNTGHLQVWGFKSKHFVVHDVTDQQDLMNIECGGAHRNWAYQSRENGGTFVWTKASEALYTIQTSRPYSKINAGGHGREIKSVAVSKGIPQLIATGAEDTDIKIFTYGGRQRLKCHQTLRKHVTGIQHSQWSEDGSRLFSSGGVEEFFVWKITAKVPCMGVGVICESAHPASGTSDLRIMGFDVRTMLIEGETAECSPAVDILMAYSDSTVRSWCYKAGTWELKASGDYLTACLTNAAWVPGSSSDVTFITTATDGFVATWAPTYHGSIGWSQRRKANQDAVLSILTHALNDGTTLTITGGDDNAISFTRWPNKELYSTLTIPRAHAAAVTTLAMQPLDSNRFLLLSASIDQRIKVWEVAILPSNEGAECIDVKKVDNLYTSIADVSSMAVLNLEDGQAGLLVCGVGMDVWRLAKISSN